MALGKQLARLFEFRVLSDYTAWASGEAYVINDVVSNGGSYYIAIQDHTSTLDDEPGTGVNWETYWELLTDEYLHVSGVTSFSPSTEKNDADVTDFDSNGWQEHMVASRGLSFDIEGYHIEDETNGVRNAGQERLEELGRAMSKDSTAAFRVVAPGGDVINLVASFDAPMYGQSTGGGNDDPAGWTVTMTVTGEPTIT